MNLLYVGTRSKYIDSHLTTAEFEPGSSFWPGRARFCYDVNGWMYMEFSPDANLVGRAAAENLGTDLDMLIGT